MTKPIVQVNVSLTSTVNCKLAITFDNIPLTAIELLCYYNIPFPLRTYFSSPLTGEGFRMRVKTLVIQGDFFQALLPKKGEK